MTLPDFSIEMSRQNIHNPQIKKYFEDVYTAYNSGSFRSATVSLWTVVVTDLLFKIQNLATVHSDTTAQSILDKVADYQKKNPKSPEWEGLLVEEISKRTDFFEPYILIQLESLRKHRHLCAHPVLDEQDALFTPSQEIVRAHIRVALEGILTSPPLMTRRIFDPLVEDLESKANIFPDDKDLSKYLEAKYLPSLSSATLRNVFRSLWKVVIVSQDERAENTRPINSRALRCIFRLNRTGLENFIEAEPDKFEGLGTSGSSRKAFHAFMREFPSVFSKLPNSLQVEARHVIQSVDALKVGAIYLYDTEDAFVKYLEDEFDADKYFFSPNAFPGIVSVTHGNARQRVLRIGVLKYAKSASFDSADSAFEHCIKPYLNEMDKDLLQLMVDEGKTNGQIYCRGRFDAAHKQIEARWVEAFGTQPDRADAPNFWTAAPEPEASAAEEESDDVFDIEF